MKIYIITFFVLFNLQNSFAMSDCDRLIWAIEDQNENLILKLIKDGADPNCWGGQAVAVASKNVIILDLLLNNGAVIAQDQSWRYEKQGLLNLARRGYIVPPSRFQDIVYTFFNLTPEDAREIDDSGFINAIDELLKLGSITNINDKDVEGADSVGETLTLMPLNYLGLYTNDEKYQQKTWNIIAYLIQRGADLNLQLDRSSPFGRFNRGDHALNVALRQNLLFLAKNLILNGSNLNNYTPSMPWTSPLLISSEISEEIFLLMIKKGADPSIPRSDVLYSNLFRRGYLKAAEKLLENGLNANDAWWFSIMNYEPSKVLEPIKLLEKYGVNFDYRISNGNNFLLNGIIFPAGNFTIPNFITVAEYLIKNKYINVNSINEFDGDSVMHAFSLSYLNISRNGGDLVLALTAGRFLLDAGASLKIKNNKGYTPCNNVYKTLPEALKNLYQDYGGCN